MGLVMEADHQAWSQVFRQLIVANSHYWLNFVCHQDVTELIHERPQLLKGLDYALAVPEAWPPTRDLILYLSPLMTRQGLISEWQGVLSRAIARSREEEDVAEIEFRLHLATLYRLQARLDEAWACLQETLTFCQQHQASSHRWAVLTHLALVARLSFCAEEALAYCQRVLAEPGLAPEIRAEALNVKGLVTYDRRQWEEALSYFEQALTLYRSMGDPYQEARLLTNRGIILRRLDRWDEAQVSYQAAILQFQAAGDQVEMFKTVMNLGNIFLMKQDYEAAIQQYKRALPVFEQCSYLLDRANTYNNLGLAYTGMRDWKIAEAYFSASVETYRNLGDTYNLANVLDNLGNMFIKADQPKQAHEVLMQALQLISVASDSPANIRLRRKIEDRLAQLKESRANEPCSL